MLQRYKDVLLYVAALALPLFILIAWHQVNHEYPKNDDGDYFTVTQQVYLASKAEGLAEGFSQAYNHRLWKPILHPVIGVPFLAAAGGNVLAGVAGTSIFFYLVFLSFVFLLIRQYAGGMSAAAGTAVIGTSSWIMTNAFGYGSELPLMAALCGALFFVVRSGRLQNRGATLAAGILSGLALCVRPVEAILILGVPVGVFLWLAGRSRHLRGRDVAIGLGIAALAVWVMLLPAIGNYWPNPQQVSSRLILLTILGVVPLVLSKHLGLSTRFFQFFAGVYLIPVLWFLPFGRQLLHWVYSCSFGEFAQITGARGDSSLLAFTLDTLFSVTGLPYLWILFSGLVGLAALFFAKNRATPKAKKTRKAKAKTWSTLTETDQEWLLLLLPAALVPIAVGGLSYNGTVRYYYASGALLAVGALIFALHPKLKFYWGRVASIILLTAIQAHILLGHVRGTERFVGPELERKFTLTAWRLAPLAQEDPAVELLRELSRYLDAGQDARVAILQMYENKALDWVADPWVLSIMSKEWGKSWFFERPWPFSVKTTAEREKLVRENYSHVLIGPIAGEAQPVQSPMSELGKVLVARWRKAGDLKREGLPLIKRFALTDQNGQSGEFLLFSIARK